jgi:hypothetical protein
MLRIAAFALLLALTAFYGFQIGRSQTQTPTPQTQQQSNGTAKNEGDSKSSIYSRFVRYIDTTSVYCSSNRQNEKNEWLKKFLCDSKITDAVIAIFTVFLALLTGGLVFVGAHQVTDTRILQRAYLSVEPGGIEPYLSLDGRLSCDVWFVNSGNLPARGVTWFIDQTFSTDQKLANFPIRDDKFDGNNLIPPHGRIRKGAPAINSAELDAFRQRQQGIPDSCWLFVWGRVRYVDGFDQNRFIDFCYRYYLAGVTWTISGDHGRQHEHGNRTDEG